MTDTPSEHLKEALHSMGIVERYKDCKTMQTIADRIQRQYVKARASIIMAAVFYLRATPDLKIYPLQKEVCLAFSCSAPSLRGMVRRISKYVESKR